MSNFETNCVICGALLRPDYGETYLCCLCEDAIFGYPSDDKEQRIVAESPAEIYDSTEIEAGMDIAAYLVPEHADIALEGEERAVFEGITDAQWDALTTIFRDNIISDDVRHAFAKAIARSYIAGYQAAKEGSDR